jgi:hypothetical protein
VGSFVRALGQPIPPAGVDLDFTASAAGLTVTRAGTAYVDNLAGTWFSVAANTARQSNKGLLVEESRTNGIRNNSMQGAVAGTPGTWPTNWALAGGAGLTSTVVGTGTQNGIDYIDLRLNGTTSGTAGVPIFENPAIITAAVGNVFANSVFLALVGGSLTNIQSVNLGMYEYNSVPTLLSLVSGADIKGSLTAALTRFSAALTCAQATVASVRPLVNVAYASGVAVDFTLRIGWPQLELGTWASSPIRTAGAAVTRAADVVTLTSPPSFGSAYTLSAQAAPSSLTSNTAYQILLNADDGTATTVTQIYRAGVTGLPRGYFNPGGINLTTAVAWQPGVSGGLVMGYAANNSAVVFSGGTPAPDATGTPPATGLTSVRLGHEFGGGNQWNGYITRTRIWPTTRLSDSQLRQVSQ